MKTAAVLGIAEARAELPALVRRMRDDPGTDPVAIGSHRKPTAYLVPAVRYRLAAGGPGGPGGPAGPAELSGPGGLLATLRRIARPIRSLAAARGITRVRVFGSVARGDDHAGSDIDIDILVNTRPDISTIDLASFALDLEALTGRAVDVLGERTLRPDRRERIELEAVEL